jgi:hypothetical protein
MKRRTASLIKSPLDWHMAAAPVPHPVIPVPAARGGTQLRAPRCTVVVDTREQNPLDFSRFEGWFAGIETRALKLGDYSIAGLEDRCVVERKDLPDLIYSFTSERPAFVHRLRVMSQYPHRLLVITTALCQVKSLQPHGGGSAGRNPFAVCHRKACAVRSAGWRKPGGDGLDARIGCQRPRPAGISGA